MRIILFILCFNFLLSGFSQKINTELIYLVKEPAKKTNNTPVIIMLHGYGSNESDLFDVSNALDSRFIVFSLRAPYPINGGGFSWYDMQFLPDQKFTYNYQQTKESRAKILSFISKACLAHGVDSTQVFLMGYSQGGIMAYDIALAASKKINGIMALSSYMLTETKLLKTDLLSLAKLKIFIAHGRYDNVIKITEAENATAFLKEKKVTNIVYSVYEMPHALTGKELNDIKQWLVSAISPTKGAPTKK
jgi:phospholipase/carboxylesterase